MTVLQWYGRRESKFSASTVSAASVGASPVRTALTSGIAAGADMFGNRIGRRIRVKRVAFRSQLLGAQTNSVADDPYNTVRLTVVRCLPGTTFTSYTVNNALDLRFSTSAGLLEVLYDRTVVINTRAKDSTGYVACAKEWEVNIPCDITVEYGGTAAGAPINQEIIMYMVSDSGAIVNPGFSSTSTFLVEYVDDA